MSLTTTILMLLFGWLSVAAAMLWGVLRITRRYHHPSPSSTEKPTEPSQRHAAAH
ncbi:hypothetical protein LOY64_10760 [Pseudomonas corrugata]|uniref:Uncharacterized protein n=1 Tax=Pseudomonas corrugata TaxID=47879 RepID=A0A3M3ERJ8_9PSED|nr:hypothetical protein [Pseudomonas corrugata]MDU9021249.1 hypothetical protein [Pseudomonas corrugata]MDU9031703.1 hypothetical protein [Pseudomonas corrugata]MDU9037227.1 hypothetical protein [Pseudomonas corrugata]QTH16245.1 hypothetical protein C4C32_10190 [Pseudomonas corrugata]RMM51379.1 hypothetical protein ALQ77_01049 [Pseudomonas corrugata]